MAEPEPRASSDALPSRRPIPSPGCLFVVALLVILVSVCLGVGWRTHQQQLQLGYFQQLGGHVQTEPVRPEWLHRFVVDRFGQEHAAGFTEFVVVNLNGTRVSDDDLLRLAGLTSLRYLALYNTEVTDAGLQHLGRLANLKELRLHNTQITDAGLQHLSGLTNLQVLSLSNTQITDAGLQHLSRLTHLKWIALSATQVTDAGVAGIESKIPGVNVLR